jgi:hypothetical protein
MRGNTRCKECLHQGLGHDEEQERSHCEGKHSKERRRGSPHQTVLICQPTDTTLRGDDKDNLGTVTLTSKDLRRILTHGQHFPFFTAREREEGSTDHWETRAWGTCDIEVWVNVFSSVLSIVIFLRGSCFPAAGKTRSIPSPDPGQPWNCLHILTTSGYVHFT